jgi:hypothetical protein
MAVLTERGTWAGTLQQRAKDGRPIRVEGRLQLETFEAAAWRWNRPAKSRLEVCCFRRAV